MVTNILLSLEVFIFVFACLNILKNIYNFVKVYTTRQGKVVNGKYGAIELGISISYVLTALIVGF